MITLQFTKSRISYIKRIHLSETQNENTYCDLNIKKNPIGFVYSIKTSSILFEISRLHFILINIEQQIISKICHYL